MVMNTLGVLEEEFRRLTWQRSGHLVELGQTLVHNNVYSNGSKKDTMRFTLGVETILPINDGGLGIRYNIGQGYTQWRPGGVRPVLSLEVKSFFDHFFSDV